jgi:cytochrome c-type biogenesis protein CcmH
MTGLALGLVLALQGTPPPAPARGGQQQPVVVEETTIDRQVRAIASELRCPVCQGLSLQDSPSELAQEMRSVIRTQLEEGKTPEQVKAYFVSSYGEWILLEPTPAGFNLTVYLLPVAAVLGGVFLIIIVARRWLVQSGGEETSAPIEAEPDPDLAPWEDIAAR